jgi:hypothetical protein
MRDTKSISLLVVSSVLLLVSAGLLCSLGYQYYLQSIPSTDKEVPAQTSSTVAALPVVSLQNIATRDSLVRIYNLALHSIDKRIDTSPYTADSLNGNLSNNLKDFYKLRYEIAALLQDRSVTPNLNLAQRKIEELKQTVEQLQYKNADVENENKRLNVIVEQLIKQKQESYQNTKALTTEPTNTFTSGTISNTAISAANLTLSAIASDDTQETNEAKQTEKLVCTFTVKNQGNAGKCDIIVVLLQPDGQVLQKSAWESGAFETNEGKKIYSCKFRCDAPKGESKPLSFSITADNYQKGNYTMQVYHNGILIGRRFKALS